MENDVFISYENGSKTIADNICSILEHEKIRCWYAPRDVYGDFATSVVDAIENSKIFVVVLDSESSNSAHVLNEVEIAYKQLLDGKSKISIIPFRVNDDELSKAMEYYVKRMHWIDACNSGLDAAISELKDKIQAILGVAKPVTVQPAGRYVNHFFHQDDEEEKRRLDLQRKLLRKFDEQVFAEAISAYSEIYVLDLGSNNGDFIIDRVGGCDKVKKIIGFEYDDETVAVANSSYESANVRFYQADVESDEFDLQLAELCQKHGIEKFNVVSISNLIMHLKNPRKMLKTVRKYLAPDGRVIIKDVDDGLNVAYPDPDGIFEQAVNICGSLEFTGYRKSGRQIYSFLKKSGYKTVKLIKSGLSTADMTYEQKEALFSIYFTYVFVNLEKAHRSHPDNDEIFNNLQWFSKNYDRMEEAFLADDFLFSLGFMSYVAMR